MRARGASVTMVLALALLMAVSNPGIFGPGVALAKPAADPPTPLEECEAAARGLGVSPDICLVNFKCYTIAKGTNLDQPVTLNDQFDEEQVTVRQSQLLCTPASKNGEPTPTFANFHLKCYNVVPARPPLNKVVTLQDQFETETGVMVQSAQYLCEGVLKNP